MKTYFAAVLLGATVEARIAEQFIDTCKPHDPDIILEAFIN